MIQVERRKTIAAPVDVVKAALSDVEHLDRLLRRVERVEVQGSTAERARVTLALRTSRFGVMRIDGEARLLPNGTRFVAVKPLQIDSRWTVEARGDATEVTAQLAIELAPILGAFARFVPARMVESKLSQELDESLQALERLVIE